MSNVLSLACFLLCFSGVWSSLTPNTVVFTGKIIELDYNSGTSRAVVRVMKILLSRTKFPSVVSVKNVAGHSSRNQTSTTFLFFVLSRKRSEGFDLIHYWTIDDEDFKDFESDSLKEIQEHSHHRSRRSVDVCSDSLECQYGGECGVLISGKPTCTCPITCGFEDEPVCGLDGVNRVTYPNLCTVRRYSCLKQRAIEVQYYGPCMVSSCKQALQEELGNEDGEYSFQIDPKCKRPIKVYCFGMKTSDPKEYLTLASGTDNHANIYDKSLPPSIRHRCGGKHAGTVPYKEGGYTKFSKVRLHVAQARIIPDDFQFAESVGNRIPYGIAGDCYSSHRGRCRKGSFSIDLSGTGMRLQSSVAWSVVGSPRGIRIQDFQRRNENQLVSANCGGSCARCQPTGQLLLEQLQCDPCDGVLCVNYGACQPSTQSFQGYRCVCPKCVPTSIKRRVCGSDSKTYESECLLQRSSCETKLSIKVAHKGPCVNACQNVLCEHYGKCENDASEVRGYRCTCQQCTSTSATLLVCASDRKTYRNSCELKQESCRTKTVIKIVYEGRCDPCRGVRCENYGICKRDPSTRLGYTCTCKKCPPEVFEVCGSDDKTYKSECLLKRTSCQTKNWVTVLHIGSCRPCETTRCSYNATCVKDADNKAQCICPQCSHTVEYLCASDGQTYPNECQVKRKACLTRTFITILHRGKCEPCEDKVCEFSSICVVDADYKASCECPKCSLTQKYVCGSDGETYINECSLKRNSCLRKRNIKVLHSGKCNPCEDKVCEFNSICVVDADYKASCECPKCSLTQKYVCGSDGETYINECSLKRNSCLRKRNIKVLHSGKCNPCKDRVCEFNSICVVDADYKASCECPKCSPTQKYVCGSDGETYLNECSLKRNSCLKKRKIKVLHDGKCNPCKDKVCEFNSICVVDADYKASCECPKCSLTQKYVCGSDGETYINECSLKRNSCLRKRKIKVLHSGKCNPCEDRVCEFNSICVVDADYKASCECPKCSPTQKYVCGSDGETYINECSLKRNSCLRKRKIKVLHSGKCNPCEDKVCEFNSICVVDADYKASCECPKCSLTQKYVCGSDGETYINECSLKRNSCLRKRNIKVLHSGKCNPCEDKVCEFNSICVVDADYKASCECPKCSLTQKYVCGSDGETYINECSLKRNSCLRKRNIKVLHSGKCNPCKDRVCEFNSICVVDADYKASCECPKCSPTQKYVCGSDGETYLNECSLKRNSCLKKRKIKVLHDGKCNPCKDKVCEFNSICVVDADYKASCECPKCSLTQKYVCGSDGETYINECSLKRNSCLRKRKIKVLHSGKCNPCEDRVCEFNSICVVDADYKASCECPKCSPTQKYVCGSDGETYINECSLKRNSCLRKRKIKVLHSGKCNPCEDKVCEFNSICVVDADYKASCECPKCSPTQKYVCGSDGETYINECSLKRNSCLRKRNIKVLHSGKCNPCKDKVCEFNSICVVDADYKASCECPKCSPTQKYVCGSDGETYINECSLKRNSCLRKHKMKVLHDGKCNPCKDKVCFYNATCVRGEDNKGYCICPQCPPLVEYVCGNDGESYMNECQARRRACMTRALITIIHKGKCDYKASCECPKCSPTQKYVCGSDGETYINECSLKRNSCLKKRKIKVLHNGKCNPCKDKVCEFNSICVVDADYKASCECPKCSPTQKYVCGSDGETYINECSLKKNSCLRKRKIKFLRNGKCSPCEDKVCEFNSICVVDADYKASCECPKCSPTQKYVCGSDGETYINECSLKRNSCLRKRKIKVSRNGKCNPCKDKVCEFNSICVVDADYKASCECPKCSPTQKYVCGSDGETYLNECDVKRQACSTKTDIKPVHKGKCNPCKNVKCSNHGICRPSSRTQGYKCVCQKCSFEISPVCGSDKRTYKSKCLLKRKSCKKNLFLYITHKGPCDLCKKKRCYHNATCVIGSDYKAYCKCPQCSPLVSYVCGSDGRSYTSECNVRRMACMTARIIEVVKKGKCDECQCPSYAKCQRDKISSKGYKCVCPSSSLTDQNKVCGSNGITYTNKNILQRESCLSDTKVTIVYEGICKPCQNIVCDHHAICIATSETQGICQCPGKCYDKKDPICGSDGQTYENECELKQASCKQQKPIKIEKQGSCDECQCPSYAKCQRDKNSSKGYKCVCPSSSLTDQNKVCGSNGITYTNKNILQRESCLTDTNVTIVYQGVCKPCQNIVCDHHAICIATSENQGICQCPGKCYDKKDPICGSDGQTYKNECELKQASCKQQKPIKIEKRGSCDECQCPSYAKCQRDKNSSKGYKCVCPSSSLTDQNKVCGSNGITYTNKNVLQRESCLTDTDVTIVYQGVCKPCQNIVCDHHAICIATSENQGICQCPGKCYDKKDPICGSDGQTYDNECELKQVSCKEQKPIKIEKQGSCDVCRTNPCKFYASCKPTSKKSYTCVCPRKISTSVSKVCASDGRTYVNSHVLRQQACLKHVDITVTYKGLCRPCRGVSCQFNAECVVSSQGTAVCKCPERCFSVPQPVCGSDGKTYKDECELQRTSCVKQELIKTTKEGKCRKPAEDVDIIYALGSNGKNAIPVFDLEKNITKTIIKQQNFPETKHGVIIFGKKVQEITPLDDFPRKPELIKLVESLKWPSEAEGIDQPLLKASEIFKDQGQPGSRRFLVIFISGELDTPNDELQKAAKKVTDNGGRIIAYKIGDHLKDDILEPIVPQDKIISVKFTDDWWRLGLLFDFLTRKTPCEIINCQYYAICKAPPNEHVRCECPTCLKLKDPVCGSDGKTYTNQCELKRSSCQTQLPLTMTSKGECAEKGKESIVFVLGSSGPNALKVFEHEKEIVKEFINNKTSPGMTFAVVTYGNENSQGKPINEPDKARRNKLIDSITWPRSGTRLHLGLEKAHEVLKNDKRSNVRKFVFVFVSGAADVTSEKMKEASKKIIDSGGEIITINVDDGVEKKKKVVPKTKFAAKTNIRDDPKRMAILLIFSYWVDPCRQMKCEQYYGTCVISISGKPECKCFHICDYQDNPVCGQDKNTYFSECELMHNSCLKEIPNAVNHQGQCEHCDAMYCPTYSKCMLGSSGKASCQCRDMSGCPLEYKRYCDSNKKIYKNLCVLKAEACKANETVGIMEASKCVERFFAGNSYIKMKLPEDLPSKRTKVVLNIRPVKKTGVLLYTDSNDSSDFLGLAMKDGYVVYRHNVGAGRVEVKSKQALKMNEWHTIMVKRRGNRVELTVDRIKIKVRRSIVNQGSTILNVDVGIYVGGLDSTKERLQNNLGLTSGYHGCLKGLVVNGEPCDLLFPGAHVVREKNVKKCVDNPCQERPCKNRGKCEFLGETYKCVCPKGFVGKRCQTKERAVYFKGNGAFVALPALNGRWQFSLSMEIRPKERNALIFYASRRNTGEDCLILDMNDGLFELRLNVGTGLNIFRTRKRLTLHTWHKIRISRSNNEVNLVVDNEVILLTRKPDSLAVRLQGNIIFGTPQDDLDKIIVRANTDFKELSFTGCLRNVIITDYVIDFSFPGDDVTAQSGIKTCSSCVGEPCGLHGNCLSQPGMTFRCNCLENFVSDLCEFREKPLYFNERKSFIAFPLLNGDGDFEVSLEIKPEDKNALILYMNGKSNKDHLAIALMDGILQLRLDAGDGQKIARVVQPLPLSKWRKIDIVRNGRSVTMSVNGGSHVTAVLSKKLTKLDFQGKMFVGSPNTPIGRIIAREHVPLEYLTFTGCFRRLYINRRRYNLAYPGGDIIEQNQITDCEEDTL